MQRMYGMRVRNANVRLLEAGMKPHDYAAGQKIYKKYKAEKEKRGEQDRMEKKVQEERCRRIQSGGPSTPSPPK